MPGMLHPDPWGRSATIVSVVPVGYELVHWFFERVERVDGDAPAASETTTKRVEQGLTMRDFYNGLERRYEIQRTPPSVAC